MLEWNSKIPEAGPDRQTVTISDTSTPVLVLRLDHHGALGIVRSLGRLGIEVYGVHTNDRAPAFRSKYCRQGFVWDFDHAAPAASVDFLLDVAGKIGGRPILLPSNDETALFVAEHLTALKSRFICSENSASLVRTLFDKKLMFLLAKQLGIPTAETVFPRSTQDVIKFCETARFPVVLKASDGIAAFRRTGKKMVIVRTKEELLRNYEAMEDPENPDLMLQEYIPGGEDSVWMFNGYFDEDSDCLLGLTGKKIHQNPVYTGMTALGICLENETVDQLTRRFMKAIGYQGILDIGYRFDARDGLYKVLDVNPRVGATFRLFVADNGMDVVRAMYLNLTGQPVPQSKPCAGRKWIVENLEVTSCIQYFSDGAIRFPEWVKSLRGIREAAWFDPHDLTPFGNMMVSLLALPFKKASKEVHGKLAKRSARKAALPGLTVPRELPVHVVEQENGSGFSALADRSSRQKQVDDYFESSSGYWKNVYQQNRLMGEFYRERHAAALRWVAELGLPPGSRVLEVGCGAGLASVALARRGYTVYAMDPARAMVETTRNEAASNGVSSRVVTQVGDVHHLAFRSDFFDLVIALGVIPWLHSENQAATEMTRVLKPSGFLIVSADNRSRLNSLVDPVSTPLLAVFRGTLKRLLMLFHLRKTQHWLVKRHYPHEVDQLFAAEGLEKLTSKSLGFGPFSFFGVEVLPDSAGVKVHTLLQRLADLGCPGLQLTGSHYLLLSQKPEAGIRPAPETRMETAAATIREYRQPVGQVGHGTASLTGQAEVRFNSGK